MKKAKLLMAIACLLFFTALAYTNLPTEKNQQKRAVNYAEKMVEIKTPHPPIDAPRAVNVSSSNIKKTPVKKTKKKTASTPNKDAKPIAEFLKNGIDWLAASQYENGGWGAGQHSAQQIKDPKAVNIDPATTAFSAMALMHAGHSLENGRYSNNLKKALEILLEITESSTENNPNITTITGTQPQNKLGQNIDVAMAAQFFAKILEQTKSDKQLLQQTKKALKICIAKIENSQQNDGSWNDRGWAPVLQSAMANNALEFSDGVGVSIDKETLNRSREYQKQNVSASGDITVEKAAGIKLYAASSTQRATAEETKKVKKVLKNKSAFKDIENAKTPPPSAAIEEVAVLLEDEGYEKNIAYNMASSYTVNKSAAWQMQSDDVLSGFGNNGGEEFLSYMMASQSLASEEDQEAWFKWHQKMSERLSKIQNGNGSWSGHHCITSPVFCTAAVIMTLTADRG